MSHNCGVVKGEGRDRDVLRMDRLERQRVRSHSGQGREGEIDGVSDCHCIRPEMLAMVTIRNSTV